MSVYASSSGPAWTNVAAVAGAKAGDDLIVAADGAHSRIRGQYRAQLGATVDEGRRRDRWLGTPRIFDQVDSRFVRTSTACLRLRLPV